METLQDLTTLALFEGTIVPESGPSSPCLHHFGPILTHPSRVTFPWSPLNLTLQSYFSPSLPPSLDPVRISSGWSGLSLILTAFKRLEVVESEEETKDVLLWLKAIKLATVRRSLECESFEPAQSGVLQDVLNRLLEPVPQGDLVGFSRSRNGSLPYPAPLASTSLSFERGSDSSVLPSQPLHTYSSFSSTTTPLSGKRSPPSIEESQSPMKKRRASLVGGVGGVGGVKGISILPVIGGKRGGNTVSTSALSSFADFSDHHDLDPLSSSDSDSDLESGPPLSSPGHHAHSHRSKINTLAQRLSEVTGISLNRCIETISRFPSEELKGINPNAEIPKQFLPTGYLGKMLSNGNGNGVNGHSNGNGYSNGHANGTNGNGHGNGYGHANGNGNGKIKREDTSLSSSTNSSLATSVSTNGGKKSRHNSISSTTTSNSVAAAAAEKEKKDRTQRPHDPNRPNFSYSALIGQAILSAPDKRLRLAEIYEYVTAHYSYYKKNECGWQNSIRHNLSLQPVFKKVPDVAMPGKKGCFWTIVEGEEWRFAGGGWQKMEKGQSGPLTNGNGGHSASSSVSGSSRNGGGGKLKRKANGGGGANKRKSMIGGTTMVNGNGLGSRSVSEEEEEDRRLDEEEEQLKEGLGGLEDEDVDAEGEEADIEE